MKQICTTKEQSSRLLEAGVRLGTADMYLDEFECPVVFEYRRIEKHMGQDMAFPAWSLSKMIEILPKSYVAKMNSINRAFMGRLIIKKI